jgi:hypothetical protein
VNTPFPPIALLSTGFLCVGCATSSPLTGTPDAQTSSATNGYEQLADGSIHAQADGPQAGFFIRGAISGRKFLPEGDVQGEGEFGKSGQPGWLELRVGSFHPAQEARAPVRPYIEGHRASDGKFRPDSRKVTY